MSALFRDHAPVLAASALAVIAGCSSVRKVSIESKPEGCEVFVDGTDIGKTPLTHDFDFPNKNTRYHVSAKLDGYVEDYVELSKVYLDARNRGNVVSIEVKEDETWTGTVPSPLANNWVQ